MRGNSPAFGCTPQEGCNWEVTYPLTIPDDWPSGYYVLEFPVMHSPIPRHVDFIVAEREPSAPILFVVDFLTAEAYNVYAGASLYGGFEASGVWTAAAMSNQISFRRPLVRSHTYGDAPRITKPVWIPHREEGFRLWLAERFSLAYISNDALEFVSEDYLEQYSLLVIAGIQEYWTNKMVSVLESYVRNGGNLYLSATEFAFGAVRFEQDGEVIRFFPRGSDDPILAFSPSQVATYRAATANLEDFFGVSLEQGKGLGFGEQLAPLTVINPINWAFEGTGYERGDTLTLIKGLTVGGWVRQRGGGRYCIVSSTIPYEQVDVLAIAPYPPLDTQFERQIYIRLDERLNYVTEKIPKTTFAIVALIQQGKGMMFVAPGDWFNMPHAHGYDTRTQKVIENVIQRLSG